MSTKRLVLFSVAWWAAVVFEVGTVGAIPGLATRTAHGFVFTAAGVAVHFTLMAALSGAQAFLFCRRIPDAPKAAVALAATDVVLGLALDALLTVPLFVKDFGAYFGKWTVWTGYVLAFLIVVAVGRLASRRAVAVA